MPSDEVSYTAADGTRKTMSARAMAEQLRRQQEEFELDADGRATKRDAGSASMAELEKSHPRLAAKARLAQVVASRIEGLVPAARGAELVGAANWPDEQKRLNEKKKRDFFRLAPPKRTERTLVTLRWGGEDRRYGVRASACGRTLALRAAWRYDAAGERVSEKLLPARGVRVPLLLTATALQLNAGRQSLLPVVALSLLLLLLLLWWRRQRRATNNNDQKKKET